MSMTCQIYYLARGGGTSYLYEEQKPSFIYLYIFLLFVFCVLLAAK